MEKELKLALLTNCLVDIRKQNIKKEYRHTIIEELRNLGMSFRDIEKEMTRKIKFHMCMRCNSIMHPLSYRLDSKVEGKRHQTTVRIPHVYCPKCGMILQDDDNIINK